MKKLATLLAVLLLISCAPASAVETALTGAEAYQQYGPWYTWTQEQKDTATAEWSEDLWYDYWDAYFVQSGTEEEQYYTDMEEWNQAFYGDAWEEDWEQYLQSVKEALGMPYPDGINVSVNGEWLDLDGLEPWGLNGRTMVPVRPFLEALGAKVDYADNVVTAVLPDGVTLELTGGSTTMTRVSGDKIDKIEMDVPLTAVANRTYIPARFAGEAVGMAVAWDGDYQAAHFTDWDSIEAQIDQNFATLNTLLSIGQGQSDPEQTYRVKELVSGSMTLYGATEAENATATLGMTMDGLVRGGQADLDMKLDLDLGDLKEMVTASMLEEEAAALDLLSDFEMEMRGDLDQGTLYMTGNKLGDIPGSTVGSGEWVALPLVEGGETLPEEAQTQALTVGSMLTTALKESGVSGTGMPPCVSALDTAEMLALILGDDCFTVSTAGSTTTYTLKVDTLALTDKVSALAEEKGTLDLYLLQSYLNNELKVDCTGAFQVRDNQLVDMELDMTVKVPALITGSTPMDISFSASGDSTEMVCTLTAGIGYGGKLEMKAEASVEETSDMPVTTPPEGAVVRTADALGTGTEYSGGLDSLPGIVR